MELLLSDILKNGSNVFGSYINIYGIEEGFSVGEYYFDKND